MRMKTFKKEDTSHLVPPGGRTDKISHIEVHYYKVPCETKSVGLKQANSRVSNDINGRVLVQGHKVPRRPGYKLPNSVKKHVTLEGQGQGQGQSHQRGLMLRPDYRPVHLPAGYITGSSTITDRSAGGYITRGPLTFTAGKMASEVSKIYVNGTLSDNKR